MFTKFILSLYLVILKEQIELYPKLSLFGPFGALVASFFTSHF